MVDGVIAFTLLEGAWLAWHHRRTGSGVAPRDFLANMVSGLCLMAGLRVALAHGLRLSVTVGNEAIAGQATYADGSPLADAPVVQSLAMRTMPRVARVSGVTNSRADRVGTQVTS